MTSNSKLSFFKKHPILPAIIVLIIVLAIAKLPTYAKRGSNHKRIGILYVNGIISDITVNPILKTLEKFNRLPQVKGIIVDVNSPGGTVAASERLYFALQRTQKPVYVAMESVAASGAYYAAMGANRIFANQATITGSIGVILHTMQYKQLLDKIGIQTGTIKTGDLKDIGSTTRKMTQKEKDLLQSVVNDMYDQFISAIAKNRKKLSKEQVRKLATGRIFTGRQALEAGLVDEIRDFDGVVNAIKHKLKLSNEKVTLWKPQKKKQWWKQLSAQSLVNTTIQAISGNLTHVQVNSQNNRFLFIMQ